MDSVLTNISDESEIIDVAKVPEVSKIELTKKETFVYNIINKYFKSLSVAKVHMMIDIVECKSKISLRLLDWFITRYSAKHKIRYFVEHYTNDTVIYNEETKMPDATFSENNTYDVDRIFNVHIHYKAQLKSFTKKYFDPFRRRTKFKYFFDSAKELMLCTTIGQLNFFKWIFTNGIINYVLHNYSDVLKSMVNTNKMDKANKLKNKKISGKTPDQTETDKSNASTAGATGAVAGVAINPVPASTETSNNLKPPEPVNQAKPEDININAVAGPIVIQTPAITEPIINKRITNRIIVTFD